MKLYTLNDSGKLAAMTPPNDTAKDRLRATKVGSTSTVGSTLDGGHVVLFGDERRWLIPDSLLIQGLAGQERRPSAEFTITTGVDRSGINEVYWFEARNAEGTLVKRSANPIITRAAADPDRGRPSRVKPSRVNVKHGGDMATKDLIEREHNGGREYWAIAQNPADVANAEILVVKAPEHFRYRVEPDGTRTLLELYHRSL